MTTSRAQLRRQRTHGPAKRLTAGALCLGLLASMVTPADAQLDIIDFEIDDGDFTGTVALNGNFSIDPGVFDSRVQGEMVVWVDVGGPATMSVQDGVVSGEWTIAGLGGANGSFSHADYAGFAVVVENDTTYDAAGTFSGDSTQAQIEGTVNSVSTARVSAPAVATSTSTDSDQFSETLTDVLAGCNQVVARFERQMAIDIEEALPGAQVALQGTVALYDDVTDDEQQEELEAITREAAALDGGSGEPFIDLFDALDLLRRVQRLQDELSKNSDCPPTKEFFNVLTNVANGVARRALDALDELAAADQQDGDNLASAALPVLVELLLATGADGAGAVQVADTLARIEPMAEGVWQRAIAKDPLDTFALVHMSALAVQMGWSFSNGHVDSADMLLVLGDN